MNQTNISSSNFRLPTFIAVALTASTISNPNIIEDLKIYNAVVDTQNNIVINSNNKHTVSNIETSSRAQLEDQENYRLLSDLGERLVTRNKDIDSQIAKIIDDNFWDLI